MHDASQGSPQIGSMSNKNKRQFSKQVPEPVEQENGLATQRRGAKLQLQKKDERVKWNTSKTNEMAVNIYFDALQVFAITIDSTAKGVDDDALFDRILFIESFSWPECE